MLRSTFIICISLIIVSGCSTDAPTAFVAVDGARSTTSNRETAEDVREAADEVHLKPQSTSPPAAQELVEAVLENDINRVQELLNDGVGWQGADSTGKSLWLAVCENGDPLIVQAFYDAGAKADSQNAKGQAAYETLRSRIECEQLDTDFRSLLAELHFEILERGLEYANATLQKAAELSATRAKMIEDFEDTRSRIRFQASLMSFQQTGWEYTVDQRFQDTPVNERPLTHQTRNGAPAPLIRGVEAIYESVPLPKELDDPLQLPQPPQLKAAGFCIVWCSARLALSPLSVESMTKIRDRIVKASQRLDSLNQGLAVSVEFPDENCRMAFRGQPHQSRMGGPSRNFVIEFGDYHSQGLEVMDEPIVGRRNDEWEKILKSRTSVGGFSGMSNCRVLEVSPIRWNGHYGYDLCTLRTYTDGTGDLYFERDLFVEGRHYHLWHRVPTGGAILIDSASRMNIRNRALPFFNTFELLKPVPLTATHETEDLGGRWVIVEDETKRLAKLEVRELAIIDKTVYLGPSGQWGVRPGTLWPVGTAETDGELKTLTVRLQNGKAMEPWTYRFEDGALIIDEGSGRPPIIHRRPGDGVPLM